MPIVYSENSAHYMYNSYIQVHEVWGWIILQRTVDTVTVTQSTWYIHLIFV